MDKKSRGKSKKTRRGALKTSQGLQDEAVVDILIIGYNWLEEPVCLVGNVGPEAAADLEQHGLYFPWGTWFVSSGNHDVGITIHGPFDCMDAAMDFARNDLRALRFEVSPASL